MSNIGTISPVLPVIKKAVAVPVKVSAPAPQPLKQDVALTSEFEAKVIEQKHFAPIQKSGPIANVHILGNSSFTIYKAPDGTLITRTTNRGDNTVRYEPEQNFLRTAISGTHLVDQIV